CRAHRHRFEYLPRTNTAAGGRYGADDRVDYRNLDGRRTVPPAVGGTSARYRHPRGLIAPSALFCAGAGGHTAFVPGLSPGGAAGFCRVRTEFFDILAAHAAVWLGHQFLFFRHDLYDNNL